MQLDAAANGDGAERISVADRRVSAWAIPTDEELTIVRQTIAVLGIDGALPTLVSAGAMP